MKTSIKALHWTPRIICILAILLLSLFAADSFAPGLTIWQQLGAFLIHLIPSFILLAFLIVAWKWEFIGGIIFTVIGVVMSPVLFWFNYNKNHSILWSSIIILIITIPFVIVGVLFILSYNKKKKFSATI
ncbi:MAG: hypothetical protein A2W99_15825 [Bacteroidetes bacterium GWF2_33_16]|nr:MAG: hypothetical protein A2X00_15170 [Bacteroidetes bacterium GWE2_32_14]OFY02372.1 MAG: hypothetical protein A2W99_15825 [Bacteroidetes bacterium GWF2_33_16]